MQMGRKRNTGLSVSTFKKIVFQAQPWVLENLVEKHSDHQSTVAYDRAFHFSKHCYWELNERCPKIDPSCCHGKDLGKKEKNSAAVYSISRYKQDIAADEIKLL